ncbi:DUF982 domain-containing protein [Mesorhizobium sp. M0644]|uniref:DUF982 domain-containing protein n=1 Tax=unclassified Mesorhizobium TaxID=325217 RepID=UPI00040954E7|nr:DUF982 domain-containing protein [Mesorhizobium sp. LSJC280B00]
MDDVRFAEPITLKFQSSERKVASSWEAIECMRQQWPDRARSRSWRAAYRTCRDALDGWRTGVMRARPSSGRRARPDCSHRPASLSTAPASPDPPPIL